MSVRRAALIAAVGLALMRAHAIFYQFRGLTLMRNFRWSFVPITAVQVLFLLPMPILLVILYRSDATLSVSRGLKRLALGTAITYAVLFAAPYAYWWIRSLAEHWPGIQWSQGGAAFGGVWEWLRALNMREFWNAVDLFTEAVFVLFLIALFRHEDETPESGPRQSRLLREAAALATLTAGLSVIVSTGLQVYSVVDITTHSHEGWSVGPAPLIVSIVSIVKSAIQELCWLVTAFIVYRMQPSAPLQVEPTAAPVSAP